MKMTKENVIKRFEACIDQFYAFPNKDHIKETQLDYIGGILQAALFILPNDDYFALKQYVYDKHGYDPGGCQTGQFSLADYKWGDDDETN